MAASRAGWRFSSEYGPYGATTPYPPDAIGLTYAPYIATVALLEQDEQTVSELRDRLFLESTTLTPILKKLEQLGSISRVRDASDERQVRVSLTAVGRRLLENDPGAALVEACGSGNTRRKDWT